jgi:chromosome segregation ATPase
MSTTVQTIQNNNINNNNKYISQLAVLRNVIIDERKKREDLEKKNLKLEEERNLFQKENENLKEGNIMKSELIEKLKIELKNYRDKKSKKQIKNFFTNLFEDEINPEEKQEQEIKEDEINYLKKQIEDLKNNITHLEEEKKIINNNLKEQITEYNKLKTEYEKKILEIEKNYENKILTLEKEIKEKNNILKPILEKNQFFTIT